MNPLQIIAFVMLGIVMLIAISMWRRDQKIK